jgi:CheY-like chemotaxis protein
MPKILLVEDNDINRDMLSRRLERKGYEVIAAVDGAEGVSKALSDQPDLVLMDMHLPVLDGWEATRQIKANPQTQVIPVIALTADAIAGEREKALAAGCDEYDTKPVDLPRLLEKMTRLLERVASLPAVSQSLEPLNLPPNQRLQRLLLTRLRCELEPSIHRIIGYSDLLLEAPNGQQTFASDLQKIHTSGMQLFRLIHAVLNPVLVEIQQQEINLLAPALRLELLTPLSTIVGYCEMLLEEAPSDLILDLQQIYASAQDLLSRVNNLDKLIRQNLELIQTINPNGSGILEQIPESSRPNTLKRRISPETHRSPVEQNSRILVVDNAPNCALLSRQLEQQGYQVTSATTEQETLQLIATLSYDLILLDVSLPERKDLKLLEQIKSHQEWQDIPVLIMAAVDEMDDVVQAIAMGANDYLTRPFQSVLLRKKVSAGLEQKQLREQVIDYEAMLAEMAQRQQTEPSLHQQLEALQLELENLRRSQRVTEIVQTDYFQQLQSDSAAPGVQESHQETPLPLKVLLVEDNELNSDMLTRRLQRCGYEVVLASDGADGVSKALSEQPHIILMDISLPVMDGWEATQQLKANSQTCRIPVIALTAHAMTGDRERALAAGCDDYDTKPIDLPRLLSKIEECLKRSAIT